jgi:hypothetical protein
MSSHTSNSRGWGWVVVVVVGGAVIIFNGCAISECSGVFKPFFNYFIFAPTVRRSAHTNDKNILDEMNINKPREIQIDAAHK